MSLVRQLASLLSNQERRQVLVLLSAMIVMALLEVAGIVSIAPFLALLSNPDAFRDNNVLAWLYATFRFVDVNKFLVFLGVLVLATLLISNLFAAMTMRALYQFTWRQNHRLSVRLLEIYLHKPYLFFLERNTAHLGKNLLLEVQEVMVGVLIPSLQLIAKTFVALFILTLLIAVNPTLALIVAAVLGGSYGAFYLLMRHQLGLIGKERVIANSQRFRIANEALAGIKDLRVLRRERTLIDEYTTPSALYSEHTATKRLLTELPRYALEIIAFGGILAITLYLLGTQRDISQLLPIIGLYAFASYRMLPALQQIFVSVGEIRSNKASLEVLRKDFEGASMPARAAGFESLPFRNHFRLRQATFRYPLTQEPVFRDLNITIKPDTSVAFVGTTGSGKTTIIDIILGLLSLDEGWLEVDGVKLDSSNLLGWQMRLGYVPQKIYLSDDSIIRNIAFGTPIDEIDMGAVERAAKLADIHDFILNELPDRYDTVVGDRGMRLSGGQQQRLGIARALYLDPSVLILDEATSALDNITEAKILGNLRGITPKKTLIMVAHRLTTVKECDEIFLLDRGRVVAHGSYQELCSTSPQFRAMAQTVTEGVEL